MEFYNLNGQKSENQSRKCYKIDVVCPGESRLFKEEEKIENYLDLAIEIKDVWQVKKLRSYRLQSFPWILVPIT